MPPACLRPQLGLTLVACALAVLACQTTSEATPAATTVAVTSATNAPAPTAVDVSVTASEPAATELPVEEDVFGPGPFNLPAPGVGLAGLSSYQAMLTLTFDGTRAGQPEHWSRQYTLLVSGEPAARQLTIAATGAVTGQLEWIERDGLRYERRDDEACTVATVPADHSLAEHWELTTFLAAVTGADEAGAEDRDGQATHHYTFDERALGEASQATSTGELWVADAGGYIVRYTLTTTGAADYFGGELEGTMTWDYTLNDAGTPSIIEVPADCPAGLVDAPLLPDASGVANMPGLLSYTTQATIDGAAAFYREQLAAQGWQSTTQAVPSADGAWLEFARDNQQLSVIIASSEAGTTVDLLVTE